MTSDIFALGTQEITVQQVAAMFLGIFAVSMLIAFAISIVMYIFQSIGLYTIARRRGIKRPWLAWIPLGDFWIVGSISDDARLVKKGRVENRRLLLLLLMGIPTIVNSVQSLGSLQAMLMPFLNADQMTLDQLMLEMEFSVVQYGFEISGSGFGLLLSLALTAAEITGLVFYYMSLWELYESCRPRQKVVFLVLSIILGLQPFFIFACRKCDYGMQPQRPQLPPQNPGWPPQNSNWPPQNQWPSQNPGGPTQWPPQNNI